MKKILASLLIAIGFTLTNCISFEYVCEIDERWPDFYGFPFVQSTDSTWVFSMSGNLFIKGFIGNVLFWSLFIYALIYFLDRIKQGGFRILGKVIIIALCALSLLVIYFEIVVFDWTLQWDHDNFKMNYYQQDLDCVRTFKFFD